MEEYITFIINYLFARNNISQRLQNIDSIFEDGISFPQFIAISANKKLEDIPNIIMNPNQVQKTQNNQSAFDFLIKNNQQYSVYSQNFNKNLIFMILTKKFYRMSYEEIITKSAKVLRKQIPKINDCLNVNYLISLLNVLTNEKVTAFNETEDQNIDEILTKSFEIAKVPLFVNKNFFSHFSENLDDFKEIFRIQTQIIFDIYSEKVDSIINEHQNEQMNEINIDFKNNDNIDEDQTKIDPKQVKKTKTFFFLDNEYDKYSDSLVNTISCSVDSIDDRSLLYQKNNSLEDIALLKTINELTKEMFQDKYKEFYKFSKLFQNDFIPIFVMKFFNITSIEHVYLSSTKDNRFTVQNKENFYAVINFLKKKEISFQLLLFSFKTSLERCLSAKLFFKNFLNYFFITKSKEEMIQRYKILTKYDSKTELNHIYSYSPRYQILIYLMKRLNNLKENKSILESFFIEYSIPFVFDNQEVTDENNMPDSYFYQMQFLFNDWDKTYGQNSLYEFLNKFCNEMKNIKVPQFDDLASRLKCRREYLNLVDSNIQNSNYDTSIYKKASFDEKNPILRTFKERQTQAQNNNYYNLIIKENSKDIKQSIPLSKSQLEDSYKFWNENDIEYKFNDGLFIKKNQNQNVFNLEKYLLKFIESPTKLKAKLTRYQQQKEKLYKLFYYDEENYEWKFNNDALRQLSTDKKISLNDVPTPLIFYVNSKREDLIKINENFIILDYPDLENQEEIFVYALCGKTLSNLNSHYNLKDTKTVSVKPIVLLVHIPPSKEKLPNLPLILLQINFYLSCICNLGVVVLDQKHAQDQIEYFQSIIELTQFSSELIKKSSNNLLRLGSFGSNIDKQLIYKKMDVVFLINYHKGELFEQIYEDMKKEKFFANILNNMYNHDSSFELININSKHYLRYFDAIKNILIKNTSKYWEIKQNFNSISLAHICSKYVQIRKDKNWRNSLKSSILERFFSIKDEAVVAIYQITNELARFTPEIDTSFIDQYQRNLIYLRKEKIGNEFLVSELQKSSIANLMLIKNTLKNLNYITNQQIKNMTRSHIRFLEKEFFEIIQYEHCENILGVYEDKYDDLSEQIIKDEIELTQIFEDFQSKIKKREKVGNINVNELFDKGTNYVLKEKENMREISVTIENDEKLNDVIEQDF